MPPVRLPRLAPIRMYERVLAGDDTWNGRFFTGVLTTGIYCLPSCKAWKPKFGNVRFFATCAAAREAGLRACRKCHPDDFERGADPVLETIETVVAEVRSAPAAFPDAKALIKRTGFGASRAFELFRLHFQTTPAELLHRARLDAAKFQLLRNDSTVAEIAFDCGFESLSTFHDNFRQTNGLTPAAYRDLREGHMFSVSLPPDYPLGYLRRALSRDRQSVTESLNGEMYTTAVRIDQVAHVLTLRLSPVRVDAELFPAAPVSLESGSGRDLLAQAHRLVVGLIGLDQAAPAFARLADRLGLPQLTAGRADLRISQTLSIFDGLLWSIIGQQINLPFAGVLRRRLIEKTGQHLPNGLYVTPTATAVAKLEVNDLLSLQFSKSKAEYVIAVARLVASGALDLESLRHMSSTRVERTLLAIRGLGPWSVNYVMMRALGWPDCVPLGDTGVTSGLQSLLQLKKRPDVDATRRLMAVFSPFRSLATAHLWQLNQPLPE